MLIRNAQLNGRPVDVRIDGNRFEAIGQELEAGDEPVLDAAGMAILPTFVNAHTHASMTLMRSYADDRTLHDWLQNHIWPLEARLDEEDIYHGARLACLEMVKSGTTCFNDMYWHAHGIARAVEEMGLRATLSSVFIDLGDPVRAREQREAAERFIEESARYSDRIRFALGPHAIYTVSETSLRWAADFARERGLQLHIHLAETEKEVADCTERHGLRPVQWLEKIGFLGPNVVAAHAIHVQDDEIAALARHGVAVAHCPASNMKLASGSFPYARMRAGGVSVALGTDGCASNNNLDMLEEMKLAALHAKLSHGDPTVLPAEEAFAMATRIGAEALDTPCGQIETGALADCMLVDLSDHRLAPGYRLEADLVYSTDRACIDTVICDGKVLMRHGVVEGEEEIVATARAYKKRFQ